jgi:hypothetical protein
MLVYQRVCTHALEDLTDLIPENRRNSSPEWSVKFTFWHNAADFKTIFALQKTNNLLYKEINT